MYKILLVEDDADIREFILEYFTNKNKNTFQVDTACDGQTGLEKAYENNYDLLLLDIMLPELDGFEICREIRRESDVPIIFITAKAAETDELMGYALGCDDYVVKPFRLSVLYEKVNALIKRSKGLVRGEYLTIGTLSLDVTRSKVTSDGDEVKLTGTLRCADKPLHDKLVRRINEVCGGVADAMGCAAQVEILEGYSALVNDKTHAQRVLDVSKRLVGEGNTLIKDAPSMGGEDFSYFLDHAPGAFFHIGCSPDANHIGAPLHSAQFKPDERAIPIGISMEMALALWD